MPGYMLDTNLFNRVADGIVSKESLAGKRLYATHIQLDEINRTADSSRREQLARLFEEISPDVVPTESLVWDVSRWGQGKWSDGKLFNKLLDSLKKLEKKKLENQLKDVLIAETAIENNLILVTNDTNLQAVAKEFGCSVIDAAEFIEKQ